MVKSCTILGLYNSGFKKNLTQDFLGIEDTEIWVMNDWHYGFSQFADDPSPYNVTRYYNLHDDFLELLKNPKLERNYLGFQEPLKKHKIECYSFSDLSKVGLEQKPFPLHGILEKFPLAFFTSSMCWMIAHAIHDGYKEIFLRRVYVGDSTELYTQQRHALLYACRNFERLYDVKIDSPWRFQWEQDEKEETKDILFPLKDGKLYGLKNYTGVL